MITKQMTMNAILELDDSIGDVLLSYGLDCRNCSGVQNETLEEAAKGHGVDLEELISVLEKIIEK